jgi:hypothetical protein
MKLLALKIDLFWKHVERRRALTSIDNVKKGSSFSNEQRARPK